MALHLGTEQNYSLGLLFIEHTEGDGMSFNPIAHVYVQRHSTHGYKGAEDAILITPQLMTEGEVDHQIDSLHRELDLIRDDAKSRLRRFYGRKLKPKSARRKAPSESPS